MSTGGYGIGASGNPASALQEIDRQARQAPIPEAVMRFIVSLTKMAHDLELPPTNFSGYVNIQADAGGGVRVDISGRVASQ